ncbi:hypothetical protein ARC20_03350 [Stenotrophomonas panacihumi]|uniref:Transmembrane protein n=1 Tax=Stenotrophomonas panacihumi TaxID=676599 RepID=A0A0R0B0S1_9GAMM|nr:hypothetical protein [Stenotrophomonas panacihumi]KRG47377.1 hypothetical protein ARC20_03350 [Stenotrophomonas panacihumi]PTN55855.1 hypothetical protein C9J98_04590 [Stenotrophomonas panacihumi]
MSLRPLLRAFVGIFFAAFLADLLRRCWIVEAWSIGSIALPLFLLAVRATWRGSHDFVRQRRIPALPLALPRDDTH